MGSQMAHSYDFAVVKVAPDPVRDEALNVALVILRPEHLDVLMTPNPERLRAVAPALQSNTLEDLATALRTMDDASLPTEQRLERLRGLPGIAISGAGTLYGETEAELNDHVGNLVSRLLKSIRAPTIVPAMKATALTRELSSVFRREKLLGRGEDALEHHKVVRNVPVSSDGTLRADFVAKNRRVHVTETVDLRTDGGLTAARLKDIAVSAVTLDEAKRNFGRSTQRYFIYAGNKAAEHQARGYLNAVEYHADHVFNFVSRDDRAKYLDFVFAALRGDLVGDARWLANDKLVRKADRRFKKIAAPPRHHR
jgi:Protein of unknown function (DUF3037)